MQRVKIIETGVYNASGRQRQFNIPDHKWNGAGLLSNSIGKEFYLISGPSFLPGSQYTKVYVIEDIDTGIRYVIDVKKCKLLDQAEPEIDLLLKEAQVKYKPGVLYKNPYSGHIIEVKKRPNGESIVFKGGSNRNLLVYGKNIESGIITDFYCYENDKWGIIINPNTQNVFAEKYPNTPEDLWNDDNSTIRRSQAIISPVKPKKLVTRKVYPTEKLIH